MTLPYAYDALEPYIDAKTVEIHHSKHHQTYVNKLNEALAKHPALESWSLDDLLTKLHEVPEDIRTAVRNHGGGVWNHNLYFETMRPGQEGNVPTGAVLENITQQWGSFEAFQEQFNTMAATLFGSGWTWLVVTSDAKLEIVNLPLQDCPITQNLTPILVCDIWEHAYYLKVQNRRPEYVDAWWKVINWEVVEEKYTTITSK